MDPKYLIGVPEMDAQHEKLLLLANKAKVCDGDEFEMNDLVMELISYANAHLDEEEAFLHRQGLDDFLKEHVKKHTLFRRKAMEFYDEFRTADSLEQKSDLLKTIGSFCENWLLEHINVEDREYSLILSKR